MHQLSLTQGYWANQWDERETGWRSFKFQFVAYYGAIDSRLKDLVLGASRDAAAMRNIHVDPDTRGLSAQPVLRNDHGVLEHVGDTEGGVACRGCLTSTSQGPQDGSELCCRELLHHGFLDPRAALDDFEVLRRWSAKA